MRNAETVQKAYEIAKEQYAGIGVDVDKAIEALDKVRISMHCWQGDDINGSLFPDQELSGTISVTGNYPGKARNADELRADLDKALSLIPGTHKVNLHAIYGESDEPIDLDQIEPKHFAKWVDWAKERGLGLDFNGTFFSHPKAESGFTLSSADPEVQEFWIEHLRRVREISNYFGQETGIVSCNNIWIPDGYKDNPIDRVSPRKRLMEALDKAREVDYPVENTLDAVEGKLFGTGVEAYTVGTHEFYLSYAMSRGILWTIDSGHFHPTEDPGDKFAAVAPFNQGLYLHVSRPMRWDSDHVVIADDMLRNITNALVYNDLIKTTHIGLDFFDATINRVAAYVVGTRNTQKALLQSFLTPLEDLKAAEAEGDLTARLALVEEYKSFPFGAVWDYYCLTKGVPVGEDWLAEVRQYEKDVLSKRA